jgi:hypothetical protein
VQLPLPPQLTVDAPEFSLSTVQPPPPHTRVKAPAPVFLAVQLPPAQSRVHAPGPAHVNAQPAPSQVSLQPSTPAQAHAPPLHVEAVDPLEPDVLPLEVDPLAPELDVLPPEEEEEGVGVGVDDTVQPPRTKRADAVNSANVRSRMKISWKVERGIARSKTVT